MVEEAWCYKLPLEKLQANLTEEKSTSRIRQHPGSFSEREAAPQQVHSLGWRQGWEVEEARFAFLTPLTVATLNT